MIINLINVSKMATGLRPLLEREVVRAVVDELHRTGVIDEDSSSDEER